MTTLGLLFDVPILVITLILIIKYRKNIAQFFKRIPLPRFLIFLISALPFMIFEENINCGFFGCQYTILPPTLHFLMLLVLVLGIIVKFGRIKSITIAATAFAIFGTFFEFALGASSAELLALPIPWFVFFLFWVGISYAYFVIVPLTILMDDKK